MVRSGKNWVLGTGAKGEFIRLEAGHCTSLTLAELQPEDFFSSEDAVEIGSAYGFKWLSAANAIAGREPVFLQADFDGQDGTVMADVSDWLIAESPDTIELLVENDWDLSMLAEEIKMTLLATGNPDFTLAIDSANELNAGVSICMADKGLASAWVMENHPHFNNPLMRCGL